MTTLSVIIVAKNKAHEIKPALVTSQFAQEIILVDNGSTDATVKIARPFVKKIVNTSGDNFSTWRNLGAQHARSDWLLYLDTDERITPQLAQEITATINKPVHAAYTIPRQEILLGKHLAHWPDPFVLRLIKKTALVKWQHRLHEQPLITGTIGTLKNYLVHLTHKNIDEKVLKTLAWSNLEAEMLFKNHHPKMRSWRFYRIILTEFIKRFIKQGLWKDGSEGNIEVIYQTFSRFITYVRLWELQHQPPLDQKYRHIDKKILEAWKK